MLKFFKKNVDQIFFWVFKIRILIPVGVYMITLNLYLELFYYSYDLSLVSNLIYHTILLCASWINRKNYPFYVLKYYIKLKFLSFTLVPIFLSEKWNYEERTSTASIITLQSFFFVFTSYSYERLFFILSSNNNRKKM